MLISIITLKHTLLLFITWTSERFNIDHEEKLS